jgi:hypothetical protein
VKRFLDILRLINCDRLEEAKRIENEMEEIQLIDSVEEQQRELESTPQTNSTQTQTQQPLNFEGEDVLRERFTKPLLDYRKKIIQKFIASIPSEVCENCHAYISLFFHKHYLLFILFVILILILILILSFSFSLLFSSDTFTSIH